MAEDVPSLEALTIIDPPSCHLCERTITMETVGVIYVRGGDGIPYCGPCLKTLSGSPAYDLPGSCVHCRYMMTPLHTGLFPLVAGVCVLQHCSRACVDATRPTIPAHAQTLCGARGCSSQLVNETRCPECDFAYCGPGCLAAAAPQHILRCRLRVAYDTLMQSVKATVAMYGEGWDTVEQMRALHERLAPQVMETTLLGVEVPGSPPCTLCTQPVAGTKHIGVLGAGQPAMLMCDACFAGHGWPTTNCYRCGWIVRPLETLLFGVVIHPAGKDVRIYQTYCGRACIEGMAAMSGTAGNMLSCDTCVKNITSWTACGECGTTFYCGDACQAAHVDHEFHCALAVAYSTVMGSVGEIARDFQVSYGPDWHDSGLYNRLTT